MRGFLIWLMVIFPWLLASEAQGQQAISQPQRKTIVPFGRPKAVQFEAEDGRTYTYYSLVKGQAMGFAVAGPAAVEIRSRAGLRGDGSPGEYQIQVWEGEYLVKADKFKAKALDSKMTGTSLVPAVARTLGFAVPPGTHNYRLWLVSQEIDTVFVRVYVDKKGGEQVGRPAIVPLDYGRRVHLYSKKNQTAYYLIDNENPLRVSVTGPLDLIVVTRANFDAEAEGRIGYSISVTEDGKEIQVLSATTTKSLSTAYQDFVGVVPSQPNKFVVKIPAGTHNLEFALKEAAVKTACVRFSVLQQQ